MRAKRPCWPNLPNLPNCKPERHDEPLPAGFGLYDHLQPRALYRPGYRKRAGAADLVRGGVGPGGGLRHGPHGGDLPRIRGEIPGPHPAGDLAGECGLAGQLPADVRGVPREIRGLPRRRRLVVRSAETAKTGRPDGVGPRVRHVLYARLELLAGHGPHRTRPPGPLHRFCPPAVQPDDRQLRDAGPPGADRAVLRRGASRRASRVEDRRCSDVALVFGVQPDPLHARHHGRAPASAR